MFYIHTDALTKLLFPFPGKLVCCMSEHEVSCILFLWSNIFGLCQIYFVFVDVHVAILTQCEDCLWPMFTANRI